jgi:hypothetical protein
MRLNRLGSRRSAKRERAHRDGLFVSVDSAEALEEVFWRVHCGPDYLLEDRLCCHTPTEATWKRFRDYIDSTLFADAMRPRKYLAKNNNLVVRLPSLLRAIPEATIVVPFRDASSHARSLRRQHQMWVQRHREDPFTLHYMSWLAHHEFGEDHRPFALGDHHRNRDHLSRFDETYWIEQWIEVYQFIVSQRSEQLRFVCYEQLCSQPAPTLKKLFADLDVELSDADLQRRCERIANHRTASNSQQVPSPDRDGALSQALERARQLYHQMSQLQVQSPVSPKRL